MEAISKREWRKTARHGRPPGVKAWVCSLNNERVEGAEAYLAHALVCRGSLIPEVPEVPEPRRRGRTTYRIRVGQPTAPELQSKPGDTAPKTP